MSNDINTNLDDSSRRFPKQAFTEELLKMLKKFIKRIEANKDFFDTIMKFCVDMNQICEKYHDSENSKPRKFTFIPVCKCGKRKICVMDDIPYTYNDESMNALLRCTNYVNMNKIVDRKDDRKDDSLSKAAFSFYEGMKIETILCLPLLSSIDANIEITSHDPNLKDNSINPCLINGFRSQPPKHIEVRPKKVYST